MLQVQGLTKIYSSRAGPAIQDVTFDVADGEVVGFVGLNGAGKTTTIRIAAGVIFPTSGTVRVDGFDIIKEKVNASRRLGWVPELPNFEQNAKALDLMKYYAGYYGIESSRAEKMAIDLLKETGLAGVEKKKLSSFSQGMKKKAILLSSHILSEVQELSDKVVFIHKGKVIQISTRQELSALEGGFLILKLNTVDENVKQYLKSYGKVEVEDDRVNVTDFKGDPSLINAELVKMGYSVREISYRTPSLEDYFFRLIKEKGDEN